MSAEPLPIELGLTPEAAQARFDELQEHLVPLWQSMERMTQDEQTIVVVCSMTLEDANMPPSVFQAYEERFLFLLLLLRQPRARLVYVTSQAVNPSVVDYYLDLLPASSRRTRASASISSRRSTGRRGPYRRSCSSARACSSASAT
jgi:hypothetical protein